MANTVAITDLRERLNEQDRLLLLDVRAEEEFHAWKLDESGRVPTLNVPYFEFMEDEDEAVARIPTDVEQVYVLCAKGGSSEWVAELLGQRGIPAASIRGGMQEWAQVVDVVSVELPSPGLRVLQIRRPATGCIGYMVIARDSSSALVIDPLEALVPVYIRLAGENGAQLALTMDTHVHADHVSGLRALAEATACEIALPEGARERGLSFSARPISDGQSVEFGGHALTVIATPGHTTESMSYLLEDMALFTGDTLFVDSVGRPDLESGTAGMNTAAQRLHSSLRRLLTRVAPSAMVLPGHFPASSSTDSRQPIAVSLEELRQRMPVMEMRSDQFVARILEDLPPQPQRHTEIIAVNLGTVAPSQDERFEMELGPNNCASTRSSLAD